MDYPEIIRAYRKLKVETAPKLLREFRGARSYAKAAEELGCHRSFFFKCEKGLEEISDELLLKLLEAK